MKKAGLKSLMKKGALVAPGAYDAATALLAEKTGFKAVYVSGAGLSASRGLTDTGVISRDEFLRAVSFIVRAVRIPVIADADTGFGPPAGVRKTVKALERLGVSAIQIEDQVKDKRCGHLPGVRLVSAPAFARKVSAAAAARKSKGFLIIARTDARSVEGFSGAISRALLYKRAGADVIFPEALESKKEFLKFSKKVGPPLMANMTEFGKTPYITADEFRSRGCSIVIFPMTCFRIAMKSIEEALKELKRKGTQAGFVKKMQTRVELYELLKYRAR